MRVVLDTNVLVAAFVARGQCHELLEHCARVHTIVGSEIILKELTRSLTKKLKINVEDVRQATALLRDRMELVEPLPLSTPTCRDPDDDLILGTARAGQCPVIVTGDRDLLVLDPWEDIRVIRPRDFWEYEALH